MIIFYLVNCQDHERRYFKVVPIETYGAKADFEQEALSKANVPWVYLVSAEAMPDRDTAKKRGMAWARSAAGVYLVTCKHDGHHYFKVVTVKEQEVESAEDRKNLVVRLAGVPALDVVDVLELGHEGEAQHFGTAWKMAELQAYGIYLLP